MSQESQLDLGNLVKSWAWVKPTQPNTSHHPKNMQRLAASEGRISHVGDLG